MMKPITQRIQGQLISANGRFENQTVLRLQNAKPDKNADSLLYLRYAFVIRGPETHIFPAFLLDDWGNEIKGIRLYKWVREFGEQFPRAEIFGYYADGREGQFFVRELELYAKLPCYLYTATDQPVEAGQQIQAVLLPEMSVAEPTAVKRPSASQLPSPLRRALVQWWQIPPNQQIFDFL